MPKCAFSARLYNFYYTVDYKAEKITPYNDTESKTGQVRQMFDSIAPAYDFMNRAMTMGIDKWWRRKAVKMVGKYNPAQILDVATGTGDFAIQMYKTLQPSNGIVGIDLSRQMLDVAVAKVGKAGMARHFDFKEGDCMALDFADGTFDAVTVAFGVRNFEHLEQGYAEMYRVLRHGGVLCVLELSTPTNRFIKSLYDLYTRTLIPMVGRMVSHDRRAYSYLPESIAAVPQGDEMCEIMRRVGFKGCRYVRMTFGTCTIYMGEK